MINVQFDHQIFWLQESGGISRYFVELAKEFERTPAYGVRPVFGFKYTINRYLVQEFPHHNFRLVRSRFGKIFLRLAAFVPSRLLPNSNVMHYTFYLPRRRIRSNSATTISTLFDMIPEISGRTGLFSHNPHFAKMKYLRNSDGVISISSHSAREYERLSGAKLSHFQTIPLGVSRSFAKARALNANDAKNFFLYVGKRDGYKMAELAFKAFSKINAQGYELVFAGGGPFSHSETTLAQSLGIADRVRQRNVSDSELKTLYFESRAFVMTSSLEGFGLPIIEAALAECPMILTDLPTSREIVGNAALFYDVGSETSLITLWNKLISNPGIAAKKVREAKVAAEELTWSRCALATSEFYLRTIADEPSWASK